MHIVNVQYQGLYFVIDVMQLWPWKSILYVVFATWI